MDIVGIIENYFSRKAKINFLDMQPGDVEISYADIDKSKKELGFKPKINIDVGVKNFLDWYSNYYGLN